MKDSFKSFLKQQTKFRVFKLWLDFSYCDKEMSMESFCYFPQFISENKGQIEWCNYFRVGIKRI